MGPTPGRFIRRRRETFKPQPNKDHGMMAGPEPSKLLLCGICAMLAIATALAVLGGAHLG